jgi:hypothetical protein
LAGSGEVPSTDSAFVDVEACVPQVHELRGLARAGGSVKSSVARAGLQQGPRFNNGTTTDRSELTTEDKLGLLQLREEEKLARDVYSSLADMSPVFVNIAAAEARHLEAVGRILAKYGLDDPVRDNAEGVFTDPEFAALYNELVDKGSESLIEAYKVGAMIEEMDIKDLQELSTNATNEDVARVYDNLMRGSRNHLRAFVAQVETTAAADDVDVTYEPQFLTQDEFDAIVNSPFERGNGEGGQRQRGRVVTAGPRSKVVDASRVQVRSGNVESGGPRRLGDRNSDGDRQRDRDQNRVSQEDPACDVSQQTTLRDRVFARLGRRKRL